MHATTEASEHQNARILCSPIVELRRYTLHPGRRDDLITLFDAEFVESQEACGMKVIGQFRDLDDPNAFVWLRGFDDMGGRHAALTAFYDGPVWAKHRDAANSTMIDSDDVLLLHPADGAAGFVLPDNRPETNLGEQAPTIIQAITYRLRAPAESGFLAFHQNRLAAILEQAGGNRIATFVSEQSENTFARLPVRLGENVMVVLARFESIAAHADFTDRLGHDAAWHDAQGDLSTYLVAPASIARLSPTARSRLC
ncbi:MAG: NIPSNAP family protein [Phyllobacterium sp.]|uniref:NIPSNAP family protein n=1 Tax=Phyllobacterium sp. TaxID=1871046 RepID=UPI0030F19A08